MFVLLLLDAKPFFCESENSVSTEWQADGKQANHITSESPWISALSTYHWFISVWSIIINSCLLLLSAFPREPNCQKRYVSVSVKCGVGTYPAQWGGRVVIWSPPGWPGTQRKRHLEFLFSGSQGDILLYCGLQQCHSVDNLQHNRSTMCGEANCHLLSIRHIHKCTSHGIRLGSVWVFTLLLMH